MNSHILSAGREKRQHSKNPKNLHQNSIAESTYEHFSRSQLRPLGLKGNDRSDIAPGNHTKPGSAFGISSIGSVEDSNINTDVHTQKIAQLSHSKSSVVVLSFLRGLSAAIITFLTVSTHSKASLFGCLISATLAAAWSASQMYFNQHLLNWLNNRRLMSFRLENTGNVVTRIGKQILFSTSYSTYIAIVYFAVGARLAFLSYESLSLILLTGCKQGLAVVFWNRVNFLLRQRHLNRATNDSEVSKAYFWSNVRAFVQTQIVVFGAALSAVGLQFIGNSILMALLISGMLACIFYQNANRTLLRF